VTSIKVSDERRAALVGHLQTLFRDSFDEDVSGFRAGEIVDHMLKTLGPTVYNQAVQDVRAHLQGGLDDLVGEVYAHEP